MENKTASHKSKVLSILSKAYPDKTTTGLKFKTPFQLLVATMLSAQSTDKQVNSITEKLFGHYNKPEDFALLEPEELEPFIKGCGLYRNKSRNIIKTSAILVNNYESQVPNSFEELTNLPGVGRKTANVVLNIAFGLPTMPVDTHIFRVSRRLGLANGKTPEQVERELLKIVPPGQRGNFHHRLIEHGRTTCRARKPLCEKCVFEECCPSRKRNNRDLQL